MNLTILKGRTTWARHQRCWAPCVRCEIGRLAKQKIFYRGTLPCDVLFLGEAPGKDEDREGEPFVGQSGELLQRWIDLALLHFEASRHKEPPTWAIANTVLCRPTDRAGGPNRRPTEKEEENCWPRLEEFIFKLAKPTVVVTLGQTAAVSKAYRRLRFPSLELAHPAWYLRGSGGGRKSETPIVALSQFLTKHF